jgi:hypothetical protein
MTVLESSDLSTEVGPFDLILGNTDDRVFKVNAFVERLSDVDVEPAPLFFGVTVSTTLPRRVTW